MSSYGVANSRPRLPLTPVSPNRRVAPTMAEVQSVACSQSELPGFSLNSPMMDVDGEQRTVYDVVPHYFRTCSEADGTYVRMFDTRDGISGLVEAVQRCWEVVMKHRQRMIIYPPKYRFDGMENYNNCTRYGAPVDVLCDLLLGKRNDFVTFLECEGQLVRVMTLLRGYTQTIHCAQIWALLVARFCGTECPRKVVNRCQEMQVAGTVFCPPVGRGFVDGAVYLSSAQAALLKSKARLLSEVRSARSASFSFFAFNPHLCGVHMKSCPTKTTPTDWEETEADMSDESSDESLA